MPIKCQKLELQNEQQFFSWVRRRPNQLICRINFEYKFIMYKLCLRTQVSSMVSSNMFVIFIIN